MLLLAGQRGLTLLGAIDGYYPSRGDNSSRAMQTWSTPHTKPGGSLMPYMLSAAQQPWGHVALRSRARACRQTPKSGFRVARTFGQPLLHLCREGCVELCAVDAEECKPRAPDDGCHVPLLDGQVQRGAEGAGRV